MSVPLFFGNPITMMISNQIDRHNADILSSTLIDLLNEIIGPRYIIRLQPELQLVSSILYYSCIFSNKYKLTPGQQLCGLKMIQVQKHTNTNTNTNTNVISDVYNNIRNYLKNKRNTNANRNINFVLLKDITFSNQLVLVLLLSLGSYLHARRTEISFLLEESISALFGDNDNNTNTNTNANDGTNSSDDEMWSYLRKALYKFYRTLAQTAMVWSPTSSGRFENLCTIVYELNLMMFLFTAEYIEPAFRLALLAYASVKIFINELSNNANDSTNSNTNSNTSSNTDSLISSNAHIGTNTNTNASINIINNAINNNDENNNTSNNNNNDNDNNRKRCSLCIDTLKNASCTPCGHIYCWECIMRCCSQQNNGTNPLGSIINAYNDTKIKCPTCRREFLPQTIRPMYNY